MATSLRILVIGGTRFIGPPLVHQLIEAGHTVTVFHRGKNNAALPPSVQHIHGDQNNLLDFRPAFKSLSPDLVIHMVAFTEPDATHFMQTFTGIAKRSVILSSIDVYDAYDRLRRVSSGPPEAMPLTENSALRRALYPYRAKAKDQSDLAYNYDKILVERIVSSDVNLPATILRLPAAYGPGDYQHRNFAYIKRMDDRRPVILLNDVQMSWRWTRGYVDNVAAAIALAATDQRAAGRIYNVGEQLAYSEAEWVRRIAGICGWSGQILGLPEERLPSHLREGFDWSQPWVADTSRLRGELGFVEPILADDALARTIAWERGNPPAKLDPKEFDYEAEDVAGETAK